MGAFGMTLLVVFAFIVCWPVGVILLIFFLLGGLYDKK